MSKKRSKLTPHDRAFKQILSTHLGVVVRGPRPRSKSLAPGVNPGPFPEELAQTLRKLKITEAQVLKTYNSILVPGPEEEWMTRHRIPVHATMLNKSRRKGYALRIRTVARELEHDLIPTLLMLRELYSLDLPELHTLSATLKKIAQYLAPDGKPSELGKLVLGQLDGLTAYSPKRGRKFSTQIRDGRIALLCELLENRTKKPHHDLVARIMNFFSGDQLSLLADDVKKAKMRGASFIPTRYAHWDGIS